MYIIRLQKLFMSVIHLDICGHIHIMVYLYMELAGITLLTTTAEYITQGHIHGVCTLATTHTLVGPMVSVGAMDFYPSEFPGVVIMGDIMVVIMVAITMVDIMAL